MRRPSPAPSLIEGLDAFEKGDFKNARAAFELAAARNDPVAVAYLGMLVWLGKAGHRADPAAAIPYFRKAAEAGLPSAQVNLALAYWNGVGVDKNETEARHWFEEAFRRRSPAATHYLGEFAASGVGEPPDLQKARGLWAKAAEKGFAPAMRSYGAACAEGRGGPADPVEGLAWLYAAAAVGADETAAASARFLAARLRTKDLAAAHKRGRALARRLTQINPWAEEPSAAV